MSRASRPRSAIAIFLYALGGLVLFISFRALDIPAGAAIQRVPREGLIAVALIASFPWLVIATVTSAMLARGLPGSVPQPSGFLGWGFVGLVALAVVVGARLLPLTVAALLAAPLLLVGVWIVLAAVGRANWATPAFAVAGAALALLGTGAYAYEHPETWLNETTLWNDKSLVLAHGYLIGQDAKSVYVAVPAPQRRPVERGVVAVPRDDVAVQRADSAPDTIDSRSPLCRLMPELPGC